MKGENYKKYIEVVIKNLEIYKESKETGKSALYFNFSESLPPKFTMDFLQHQFQRLDSHARFGLTFWVPAVLTYFYFIEPLVIKKILKEKLDTTFTLILIMIWGTIQNEILKYLTQGFFKEKKVEAEEGYQKKIEQKLQLFGYTLSKSTLICPISLEYFEYPIFNKKSGHSYEDSDFAKALKETGKDPLTKGSTQVSDRIPNVLLYQTLRILLSSKTPEEFKEEMEKLYTCPITGKPFTGELYTLCDSGITISKEGLKDIDPITGKTALAVRNYAAETFLKDFHECKNKRIFNFFLPLEINTQEAKKNLLKPISRDRFI